MLESTLKSTLKSTPLNRGTFPHRSAGACGLRNRDAGEQILDNQRWNRISLSVVIHIIALYVILMHCASRIVRFHSSRKLRPIYVIGQRRSDERRVGRR